MIGAIFLFAIFFDYHKKHNIHKAFAFMGLMAAGVLFSALLLKLSGLYFILFIPPGLFLALIPYKSKKPISRKNNWFVF